MTSRLGKGIPKSFFYGVMCQKGGGVGPGQVRRYIMPGYALLILDTSEVKGTGSQDKIEIVGL